MSRREWCWLNWVIALAGFSGWLDNHYPSDKILQFAHYHQFLFPKIVVSQPLADALTVFTDGSSNGIASLIIQDNTTTWRTNYKSAQEVELFAVFQALLQISAPFNLYSDSQYIIRALNTIETVPFIGTLNSTIQTLFHDIQHLICSRINKCYFGHIRAHSGLPGPLAQGSALADEATRMIFPSLEQMAKTSHSLHHQNSNSLRLQFGITREAARQIVKQCQTCPQFF